MINLVLILAVVAFVGVSMFPLLEGFLRKDPAPGTAATSSTTLASTTRQSELESQSRGYELVLQREPDNQTALEGVIDARRQLAQAKLATGDSDGAKADIKSLIPPLEKLAKLKSDQPGYRVLLAQSKQYLGDREGAAEAYRAILTNKPGELIALQGLVALLMEQQRPEAAVGLLQDTLKTATQANQIQANSIDVTSVQLLLGNIYAEQQRYTEAIAIYDEAIKKDKQDFRPILAKAIVLKEQGKVEEAKPLFVTATSLAPSQYKDQINQLSGISPSPTGKGTTKSAPKSPSSSTPATSGSNVTPVPNLVTPVDPKTAPAN